jgi:rhodanese-related sulfurtransferase
MAGAGRRSRCEALAEVINAKVEVGLSARRIYQDLVEQNGFSDSYQSVRRFVRKLKATQPQRVWRMETRPGEEVQVDFGLGVYCASGEHCTSAIQLLRDLGYLNVGSLKGGLQGWLEAGGLVESSGGRNSGSSRQTRPICARSDW